MRIIRVVILIGSFPWTCFASGSILDFFWQDNAKENVETAVGPFPGIPYEVSETDESFIKEAARWIGTNLSKLDVCHHRVILKLKKSCHELNAEQLGKLAVMLLNCQSDAEGRQLFACSEEMSLMDCTRRMDSDTWNTYHLITNRAKAICATVRHDQFRGLTEMTVNKLMNSAAEQIAMMDELAGNQRELQDVTHRAVEQMTSNNNRILTQQNDIMRLSEVHRAKVESNFRDLVREKSLIKAGQMEVATLLTDLRNKVDDTIKQLELGAKRSKINHASLLSDMENLQRAALNIADRIEQTSTSYDVQREENERQYHATLKQLAKINDTVAAILGMIATLQRDFETKLGWMMTKIGGSDRALESMNAIIVHFCYLLFGMICLSFVGADKFVRIFFILAVPGNLALSLLEIANTDVIQLSVVLVSFVLTDLLFRLALKYFPKNETSPVANANTNDRTQSAERESPARNRNVPNNADEESNEEDNETTNESSSTTYISRMRSRFSRERSVTPLHLQANGGDPSSRSDRRSETPFEEITERYQQCLSRTIRGEQCRSAAVEGRRHCRIHEPRG